MAANNRALAYVDSEAEQMLGVRPRQQDARNFTLADLPRRLIQHMLEENRVAEILNVMGGRELAKLGPERRLAEALRTMLDFDSRLRPDRRAIALMGYAGSGRTSALAKLAANLQGAFGLKIGIVIMGGGSGRHRLQGFAEALRMPLVLASGPRRRGQDLKKALQSLRRCDLVLIDTPDYKAEEQGSIELMLDEIGHQPEIEPMLVLPATLGRAETEKCLKDFEPAGFNRVIISRLDQVAFVGPFLSPIMNSHKKVSFFSFGKRVPDDMEPASPRRLSWMIMRNFQ